MAGAPKVQNVAHLKAGLIHGRDELGKAIAALKSLRGGDFRDHEQRLAQRCRGSADHVQLGALGVDLEPKRTPQIPLLDDPVQRGDADPVEGWRVAGSRVLMALVEGTALFPDRLDSNRPPSAEPRATGNHCPARADGILAIGSEKSIRGSTRASQAFGQASYSGGVPCATPTSITVCGWNPRRRMYSGCQYASPVFQRALPRRISRTAPAGGDPRRVPSWRPARASGRNCA